MNAREYENNYRIQKMFAKGELPEVPLQGVTFLLGAYRYRKTENQVFDGQKWCAVKSVERVPPTRHSQQFFLFEGKWRNTERRSQFGAVTFDEDDIPSEIEWH